MSQGGQGVRDLSAVDPFRDAPSTTRLMDIGTRVAAADGRVFYYAKAAGNITAGQLVQTPTDGVTSTIAATYFGVDIATAPVAGNGGAIGDTTIRINDCGVAQDANESQEGYLCTTVATGLGYMYKIKKHGAITTASDQTVDIELYAPGLYVALDNTSVGLLFKNPYMDVSVHDADTLTSGIIMGVAHKPMSTGQYGFLQTWGPCMAVADSSNVTANIAITASVVSAQDGEIGDLTNANVDAAGYRIIGHPVAGITSAQYGVIFLEIMP